MFTSTMRGMSGPTSSRMAFTRDNIFGQARAADLHFDRPETFRQKSPCLFLELIDRKVEIDPPGINFYPRIVSPQKPPQGKFCPFAGQVPKGNVHGRDGKRSMPSPSGKMKPPPHLLPEMLDAGRIFIQKDRFEIVFRQTVDRPSADPDGIGVSQPFQTIFILDPYGDQFEEWHFPVGGIGQAQQLKESGINRHLSF